MTAPRNLVWCRHHTKPAPLKDGCTLGLDPRAGDDSKEPGGFYRLPCHTDDHLPNKRTCPKRDLFTPQELAAQDLEGEAFMKVAVERLNATIPLVAKIKGTHRGKSATGTDPCPVCGKTVRWSHAAYNNHIAMQCETKDCINFME